MSKLSKKPRIPIPGDLKRGDVLVLRNGQRREFLCFLSDGDSVCGGIQPGGHHADGSYLGPIYIPEWDVVAIKRRSATKAKKPKPDKDAAWLLRQLNHAGSHPFVRRIRAIAKRLNGGVAP